MINSLILILIGACILFLFLYVAFWQYKKVLREAKNYERGLKMVPLLIHLPPSTDDIDANGRDVRDITEEAISQAQILYNIIASTATKGFKAKLYGQRHITFEIVAAKGLIHYYAVVPVVLVDVVRQAVVAAYPATRLEECEEHNIFSDVGKITGTIGGELVLKKDFSYPIATYQETKRDATQALLNALSTLTKDDGAAVQILLRPAAENWTKVALSRATKIRKDKGTKTGASMVSMRDLAGALWKPPEAKETKPEDKQLTSLEQSTVDAIEDKTRHPGYEVLIRVITSSNTAAKSQAILKNIVATFALFDAPSKNGFKFSPAKSMEEFVTSFIFRFFSPELKQNVLNSVELATIFHFPDQRNTPTSQLQRQATKQVDGPTVISDQGILLGYNDFRGAKKEIRLADVDRRRHVYIIGQTGTGKSGLLENLALQDMLDGKGFAFVDPHGDSVDKILGMVPKERVEDVIYFSPGDLQHPIGLNLFEFETKEQMDFLIQEAIAMLYRLYDPGHTGIIGPRYEHWFRNGALTIMSDPAGSSFIDIPQVFNDTDFAKAKLKYVTDPTVLDFWNKEMAQTSDYHKSEVLGWFVSKFGAFLSNEMMRNVIGQTKSGFNLREIMDNRKILLVNLSKGKTGELNSQLLGMIFIMKFQSAAMGRADIDEDKRQDFSLYVDEFQNFATESFETILSEARKYRLNLVLANQFMTQLSDKIREAIIGNVGTIVSGRIGTTDAELMAKKFTPTFDAEDLTKLPNFESIASVMINNVPSSAFSMSLVPPLGKPNNQLRDALKRLSSAKYGRPRQDVEQEIFKRLRAGETERAAQDTPTIASPFNVAPPSVVSEEPAVKSNASFLDEWLAKRKQQAAPDPSPVSSVVTEQFAAPAVPAPPPPPPMPKPTRVVEPAPLPKPTQSTDHTQLTIPKKTPIHKASETDKPDNRFHLLEKQGIGSSISFTTTGQTSQPVSAHDSQSLERVLAQTRHDDVMQADDLPPVQPVQQQPTEEELDQIAIDIRGKLSHKIEDDKNN